MQRVGGGGLHCVVQRPKNRWIIPNLPCRRGQIDAGGDVKPALVAANEQPRPRWYHRRRCLVRKGWMGGFIGSDRYGSRHGSDGSSSPPGPGGYIVPHTLCVDFARSFTLAYRRWYVPSYRCHWLAWVCRPIVRIKWKPTGGFHRAITVLLSELGRRNVNSFLIPNLSKH